MPHHVGYGKEPMVIPYVNWDNIAPAGGINSSVKEMANWLIMNLNNGKYNEKQLLSEQRIWEMRSVQTPLAVSQWTQNNFPSIHYRGYGLGWSLFDYHGK
jgi:CubicO group peptidase (beta-lactamase class C family)